jgi:hypothetical protein
MLWLQTFSFIIQPVKWTSLETVWKKLLPSSPEQTSMPYLLFWIRRLHVSLEQLDMYKTTECHVADDSTLCGHKPGENLIPCRLIKCSLVREILWNSCWWHLGPYLWITRCMDIQVLFFSVNILGTSTSVVFSTGYTGFFCCITSHCGMIHFYCTSVCVYIEIVALDWNSYANNMVGENIVKYTSRMWNIK